ncbi:MAG: hypothetical protein IJP78_10795 [Clostridia bacterium]|nr:hypothetical protein [Clostridia bacterium]MBQ6961452.1 hypothetical protein [Clostridia bacterium]
MNQFQLDHTPCPKAGLFDETPGILWLLRAYYIGTPDELQGRNAILEYYLQIQNFFLPPENTYAIIFYEFRTIPWRKKNKNFPTHMKEGMKKWKRRKKRSGGLAF